MRLVGFFFTHVDACFSHLEPPVRTSTPHSLQGFGAVLGIVHPQFYSVPEM